MPKYLHAHKMVAETATEMAQALFEVYASENAMYKQLRKNGEITEGHARAKFVARVASMLFEDARKALAVMLAQSDDRVTQHMKTEIYEALIADNEVRALRPVSADQGVVPSFYMQ